VATERAGCWFSAGFSRIISGSAARIDSGCVLKSELARRIFREQAIPDFRRRIGKLWLPLRADFLFQPTSLARDVTMRNSPRPVLVHSLAKACAPLAAPRFGRTSRAPTPLGGFLAGCCLLLAALAAPQQALGGGGPENVLLVVNSSSWASQAVANEFVRLRQIPPANLFYIAWDGGFESIEIQTFRDRIMGPVLKTVDERGLGAQIDYVAYSSDFPCTINLAGEYQGQQLPPELSAFGSLNAMTFLWPYAMLKSPAVLGLRNNQYARVVPGRAAAAPPQAFHSWYGWAADGAVLESGGQHYLLSTLLAMTSGRGNSVDEALSYLRRSARADGTQPAGTIYYMKNGDVRSKARDGAFVAAAAALEKLGVSAVVAEGTLPSARPDVQGAMIGAADFSWPASGSTILPGAICEHLTSYGGILTEGAGQTPLTEFLRYGAAGASGTVVEPYAIQEKFPVPAVQVYYASGCTLAEAFYQSLAGPYQLLVVGDPLARPWANIPRVRCDDVKPGAKLKGRVEFTASFEFPPRKIVGGDRRAEVDRQELFVDGSRTQRLPAGQPLALDTTQLGDGYHELRIVAIEAGPIETQGRLIVPITVDNRGRSIEFSTTPAGSVRWDQKLVLEAKAPGMSGIAFFHNGRLIGRVAGAEGQVEVNPRVFGSGPVSLRAVGLARGGPAAQVHALPVELDVQPARPLAALKEPAPSKLVRGLLAKLAGGETVPVQETLKPHWLAEAGVKPGAAYEIEAYFDVAPAEIYQFQIWHFGELKLAVDGTVVYQEAAGDNRQRFAPVNLAAGMHHLTIDGKAGEQVELRLLFGGPGSKSLNGATFRHLAK
jgi:uncharacterized protein (TIGR03790 family)